MCQRGGGPAGVAAAGQGGRGAAPVWELAAGSYMGRLGIDHGARENQELNGTAPHAMQ